MGRDGFFLFLFALEGCFFFDFFNFTWQNLLEARYERKGLF